jgi:hypothetical protein
VNERQGTESDWATQIVDGLEGFVGSVKSKTTEPVQKVAKMAVFGFMGVGVVIMMFLLLTIMLVRLLDWFLPVWAAYIVLGGMFSALGLFMWSLRHPRQPKL